MYRFFFILLSVLLIDQAAFCANKILLHPSVSAGNGDLFLMDIASVSGNGDESSLAGIIIPARLYSDGYVDRKEISVLLKSHTQDVFFIYGSAVRVIQDAKIEDDPDIALNEVAVKRGDRVNLIVRKNGIYIEIMATALNNGRIDDEILVKLERNPGYRKIVKARIKSKDQVEAVL